LLAYRRQAGLGRGARAVPGQGRALRKLARRHAGLAAAAERGRRLTCDPTSTDCYTGPTSLPTSAAASAPPAFTGTPGSPSLPGPMPAFPGHAAGPSAPMAGGSGLLVTEELVRAVRSESAVAIKCWFGVSTNAVWNWRRAFGVTQWGTEGSRRLHQALS